MNLGQQYSHQMPHHEKVINCVIEVDMEKQSSRLRPFGQSLPLPLFPVGGYPIIFHHLQALGKLTSQPGYRVQHVFLHGRHAPDDFLTFLDSVQCEFEFTIEYLWEREECAQNFTALFRHKEIVFKDQPNYLLIMDCDICSCFPLTEMFRFQAQKRALLTIMTTQDDTDENHALGAFNNNPITDGKYH